MAVKAGETVHTGAFHGGGLPAADHLGYRRISNIKSGETIHTGERTVEELTSEIKIRKLERALQRIADMTDAPGIVGPIRRARAIARDALREDE